MNRDRFARELIESPTAVRTKTPARNLVRDAELAQARQNLCCECLDEPTAKSSRNRRAARFNCRLRRRFDAFFDSVSFVSIRRRANIRRRGGGRRSNYGSKNRIFNLRSPLNSRRAILDFSDLDVFLAKIIGLTG